MYILHKWLCLFVARHIQTLSVPRMQIQILYWSTHIQRSSCKHINCKNAARQSAWTQVRYPLWWCHGACCNDVDNVYNGCCMRWYFCFPLHTGDAGILMKYERNHKYFVLLDLLIVYSQYVERDTLGVRKQHSFKQIAYPKYSIL